MPLQLPHAPLEGHTSARIAAIAARQHALITMWQLYELGLDTSAVGKRVARGALRRRYRGVYVVGQPKLSPQGEYLAAVLATGPCAALSHRPAGKLHGISRFHPPCIAVVTTTKRRPKGVEVHRVRTLDPRTSRRTTASRSRRSTARWWISPTTSRPTNSPTSSTKRRTADASSKPPSATPWTASSGAASCTCSSERSIEHHHAGSAGTKSAGEDAGRDRMLHANGYSVLRLAV